MKSPMTTVVALSSLCLVLGTTSANAQRDCQDRLGSQTYLCTVKSDLGDEFEDCFRFVDPGVVSAKFDLSVDGAGVTAACTCDAKGTVKNPKFDEGPRFLCTAPVTSPGGISWLGTPNRRGNKIKNGTAVNEFGVAFDFTCELATCAIGRSAAANWVVPLGR